MWCAHARQCAGARLLTDDWACVMLLLTLCMASSCSRWISAKDLALVTVGTRLEGKSGEGGYGGGEWISARQGDPNCTVYQELLHTLLHTAVTAVSTEQQLRH